MSENLWKEFRVGNELALKADGILYASRYNILRIEAHREQAIGVLKSMGVTLVESGEEIGGSMR